MLRKTEDIRAGNLILLQRFTSGALNRYSKSLFKASSFWKKLLSCPLTVKETLYTEMERLFGIVAIWVNFLVFHRAFCFKWLRFRACARLMCIANTLRQEFHHHFPFNSRQLTPIIMAVVATNVRPI